MPNGNSRFIQHRNDLGKASPIISALNEDTDGHPCSIGDCYRLGKYNSSKSRSHPLLVSLNSTADVHNILSNRQKLPSSTTIKADLSPTDRKIEGILLKERWRLIQSRADQRTIKIRGPNIYLNKRLYGKVNDLKFSLAPNLGDLVPQLSSVAPKTHQLQPLELSQPSPSSGSMSNWLADKSRENIRCSQQPTVNSKVRNIKYFVF